MTLSMKDIRHIFERLREGMVPERGLRDFAVGIDRPMEELKRILKMARENEGCSKFLRGDYGCGKTFMSQLTMLEALEQNFAVSKVVVSPIDTPFYKFDEVYSRIAGNLQTAMARGGALGDCIDRWIAKVEDRLIAEGEDENSDHFDTRVRQRFEQELAELSKEEAGADFISAVREYFRLKQDGDIASAMQILAWLLGSKNIAASVKRAAGVKGEISSQTAFIYLKGILLIIKKAGYAGLLVVIDEIETVLRMRADVREKSLNGMRQILDATPDFKGLFWLFTGTPEFFDSRKGVAGLAPLHDRIYFQKSGDFVNMKQPQLEIQAFDKERLVEVALRLRERYPSDYKHRIMNLVSDAFIHSLVDQVTNKFGGEVRVIPRQFLREFVDVLDLVDQHEAYDPMTAYHMNLKKVSPEEEQFMTADNPDGDTDNNTIQDTEF